MTGLTPAEMKIIHGFIRDLKEILEKKEVDLGEERIAEILTKYREEIFERIERDYQWVGTYNVHSIVQKVRDKAIHELLERERKQPVLTIKLGWGKPRPQESSNDVPPVPMQVEMEMEQTKPKEEKQSWRILPVGGVLMTYAFFFMFNMAYLDDYATEAIISGFLFFPVFLYGIVRYSDTSPMTAAALFAVSHMQAYLLFFYADEIAKGGFFYLDDPYFLELLLVAGIVAVGISEGRSVSSIAKLCALALLTFFLNALVIFPIYGSSHLIVIAMMGWSAIVSSIVFHLAIHAGNVPVKGDVSKETLFLSFAAFPFAIYMFLPIALALEEFGILALLFFGISAFFTISPIFLFDKQLKKLGAVLYLVAFNFIWSPYFMNHSPFSIDMILSWPIFQGIVILIIFQWYRMISGDIGREGLAGSSVKTSMWMFPLLAMVWFGSFLLNAYTEFEPIGSILFAMISTPPLVLLLLFPLMTKSKGAGGELQITSKQASMPPADGEKVNITINRKRLKRYYSIFRFNWILLLTFLVTAVAIGWGIYLNFYLPYFSFEEEIIGVFMGSIAGLFALFYIVEAVLTYFLNRDYRTLLDYWLLNEGVNPRITLEQPIGNLPSERVRKLMAKLVREGTIVLKKEEMKE